MRMVDTRRRRTFARGAAAICGKRATTRALCRNDICGRHSGMWRRTLAGHTWRNIHRHIGGRAAAHICLGRVIPAGSWISISGVFAEARKRGLQCTERLRPRRRSNDYEIAPTRAVHSVRSRLSRLWRSGLAGSGEERHQRRLKKSRWEGKSGPGFPDAELSSVATQAVPLGGEILGNFV